MNIDNINKLINHLERMKAVDNAKPFDMGSWFDRDDSYDIPPREVAKYIIDVMEGSPAIPEQDRFKCNTVACIAGHAALIAETEGSPIDPDELIQYHAERWLGLDHDVALDLFVPSLPMDGSTPVYTLSLIKLEHAIIALKTLQDKGYVDWPFKFYPRDEKHPEYEDYI